jgi:hypothetical protein
MRIWKGRRGKQSSIMRAPCESERANCLAGTGHNGTPLNIQLRRLILTSD